MVAWTQAVAAWAAAGEAEEVRRVLRSMEARAGGAPAPNAVTFHAALGALAAAGRVAGAVSVLCRVGAARHEEAVCRTQARMRRGGVMRASQSTGCNLSVTTRL